MRFFQRLQLQDTIDNHCSIINSPSQQIKGRLPPTTTSLYSVIAPLHQPYNTAYNGPGQSVLYDSTYFTYYLLGVTIYKSWYFALLGSKQFIYVTIFRIQTVTKFSIDSHDFHTGSRFHH